MKSIKSVLISFLCLLIAGSSACVQASAASIFGNRGLASYDGEAYFVCDDKVFTDSTGQYKYKYAPVHVDWELYEEEGGYADWPNENSGIMVTKYIGKKKLPKEYHVPEKLDGRSVRAVGANAFKGQSFTKLFFGKDIYLIDENAFKGCGNLKKVSFKNNEYDGDIIICEKSFADCPKLSKVNFKKRRIVFLEKAFYNCPKLKSIRVNRSKLDEDGKALGYYRDKKTKKDKKVPRFSLVDECDYKNINPGGVFKYAVKNKMEFYYDLIYKDGDCYCMNPGVSAKLMLNGKIIKKFTSSDSKVVGVKKGTLTTLKKGTVKIKQGKKLLTKISVYPNPRLEFADVSVKAGETTVYTCDIYGKAPEIDNKYTSTSIAQIVAKPNSDTIKVKGLKKGTTTVKVKVNGVKTLKLKVKVK